MGSCSLTKTETGYSRDFTDKEGNLVMVDFNSFNGKIWLVKDMLNKGKYLSTKEFDKCELEYYEEYGDCEFWEEIAILNNYNELIMLEKASSIFDKYTLSNIKEMFMALFI